VDPWWRSIDVTRELIGAPADRASLFGGATAILDVARPTAVCSFSLEGDMTYMNARQARIGFITLVVPILTVGICGEAVAKAHKHPHRAVLESHAQVVSEQPAELRPMRYYGGPKSPMWR
jgi:hypothetical protein